MRSSRLLAVLVGFAAITFLAAEASATYHPTLGQFLQRDPIGYADGMSLYEYCQCRPIAGTDPTGQAYGWLNELAEKVGGVLALGPKDALRCTREGDIGEAAIEFGEQCADESGLARGSELWQEYADAAVHAYWAATMVKEFGLKNAAICATLHELGEKDRGPHKQWGPDYYRKESEMDDYNNEVGIQIGLGSADDQDIRRRIKEALKKGSLVRDPDDERLPGHPPWPYDYEPASHTEKHKPQGADTGMEGPRRNLRGDVVLL
jgi:hypothetical protein